MNYYKYYDLYIRGTIDYLLIPDINVVFNGACARGHSSFAISLLENGAQIDNLGYMAVDAAIANNHVNLVKRLIEDDPRIKGFIKSKYINLGFKDYIKLPDELVYN